MTSRFTIAEQSGDEGTIRSSNDNTQEKKAKPPPIDISAAVESQGMENDPKTPISAVPVTPNEMMDGKKSKVRKIGHRRVNERGQITFKKIGTSQIMLSIQLGIGYAVGSLASKPERDLLMQDFTIVETTSFPPDGSNVTPAHHFSEFRFKTYAPLAFRYFRDLFGIRPDDFLLSLCHHPMRELSNPGASGSIFYLTDDDEFIIKTVQHKESEFLQKLLPGYYMNLNQNPRTLLPKFYGLYCYQCSGKNIRMVVMNNLLPSCIRLHEKYDLKGSTYKRKASKQERKKESPTFKDLDFIDRHPDGILLESDNYNALIKTMQRDCRVLESFKIMDYSLLVGIHNIDVARKEKLELSKGDEEEDLDASYVQVSNERGKPKGLVHSKSINKQRLAAFSTAMESIQAENEMVGVGDDDFPPGGIPAKNSKGESLLLFLGIIDILQSFRFVKKLEHTFKSVFHDGDTVSVHRPGFYSQRFLQFMSKTVFKKMPSALKHTSSKRKGAGAKKTIDPKTPSSKIPSEAGAQCDKAILPAPVSVQPMFSGEVSLGSKLITSIDVDHVSPKVTSIDSGSKTSVRLDKTDVVSLSQIVIQTESTIDFDSEKSNVSTTDSSTLHTLTLSSPFSVEGSTPSCTEGTPSYTESSSSGDVACPTTPVKCINKSLDSLPPLVEAQVLETNEKNEDVLDNCDIKCEKQTRL